MEEEGLNESKRRKIEETVLQILNESDMEIITEFAVRSAASERLGIDLSELAHRRLVHQLVDSFLLSTAAAILGRTAPLHRNDDGNWNRENAEHRDKQRLPMPPPRQRQRQQQQQSGNRVVQDGNQNGKVICKLSKCRRVTVHDLNGTKSVTIQDFYKKDGCMLRRKGSNTGVSLSPTQWSSLRNSFPSIQEAILKLESRLRSAAVAKQSEAETTNSVANSASEKSQTEAGISNFTGIVHPPIKRKQTESELNITNSVEGAVAEKSHTQGRVSNLTRNVHSPVLRKQTEADTSRAASASNAQEHILAEVKQEEAGTYGSIATSNSQEQISADISTSVPALATDTINAVPAERRQPEAEISTTVPAVPAQGQLHHAANASRPERLIPIQPARLDGKNYHSWRHQMEFFLNQLNIAYVLAEPCPPNLSLNIEASSEENVKAKAALQKWNDDNYICCHNILNSLSDHLFQFYSQKGYSARELWEELKSVYNEDFGTKRSQINKYVHFQMVEGVPILEQVQELHKIADSIMASGTWIDEYFHVSVILSKLPPSWKEFRVRLMREEFLPVNMLMHRLQVEEEARNSYKKETNYKKGHISEPKPDHRLGMRKPEYKRLCYSCGKEGHINKYCPDRKFEAGKKINDKENAAMLPNTGIKIVEPANPEEKPTL